MIANIEPRAWWARSIRWKLVALLCAVSVAPMLIASYMATQVVAMTFQGEVEDWLYQISRFFLANVDDERQDTVSFVHSLVEQGLLTPLVSDKLTGLPRNVADLVEAPGYDLLMIYDDTGKVVFSSKPVEKLRTLDFNHNQKIYTYTLQGQDVLLVGAESHFTVDGKDYRVLLGDCIDDSFISSIDGVESLEIRVYYQLDGSFERLYSSQAGTSRGAPLTPEEVARVAALAEDVPYLAKRTDDEGIATYLPLRANGRLVGVVYSSFKSRGEGWINRSNLFVGIFLVGMAISVVAGLMLASFFTRPLVRLAAGVNAIARGDFGQHVDVPGRDELGQLALAFNSMARQLEGFRKMEAKLRRRERMTTLGEVAAGFAHEVRNPLGIIKTSAELLQNSPNLTAVETRRLGYVVDEVRRIDRLIRDFLAFAKPPMRMSEVRPGELVTRVLDFCQSELDRRHVEVVVDDAAPEARVLGDPDQLIQACLNLVLNAVEAMDPGPDGAAPGRETPRPRLVIHIGEEEDEVRIRFSDNGPGIDPAVMGRIFDPFFTTKASGTGLGLAKVFAVAEGHRGTIEVRNRPSGGADFDFVLPLASEMSVDDPHHPDR